MLGARLLIFAQEVDHLGRSTEGRGQADQGADQRPFMPVGKHQSDVLRLMGQAGDMLRELNRQLSKDWPASFLQVGIAHARYLKR
jgi:hypothetical protein